MLGWDYRGQGGRAGAHLRVSRTYRLDKFSQRPITLGCSTFDLTENVGRAHSMMFGVGVGYGPHRKRDELSTMRCTVVLPGARPIFSEVESGTS